MSPETLRTKIADTNATYLGIDTFELMDTAGEGIAKKLLSRYGKSKSYAFLCGLGNNGGDGFSAARHLSKMGAKEISVYLVGRQSDIQTKAAYQHWELLRKEESVSDNYINIQQDVSTQDIENHDVLIECLVGTGIKGKLHKRFRSVISRATHFRNKMVAIDVPVPGYSWDLSISMMYPKTPDAVVVDIGMPPEAELYTGPGEVQALFTPRTDSYKSQNGKLLIIGGSEEYHGAPLISASVAAKYAGLVYFYSVPENRKHIKKMESKLTEFIGVDDGSLEDSIRQSDALLIGPGWQKNIVNEALLNHILSSFPERRFILDAVAMSMANLELVKKSGNVLFTPHRGELKYLIRDPKAKGAIEGQLKRFVREFNCFINLKGSNSLLFGRNFMTGCIEMRVNRTGNQGMAKGGSGDMLAGITAALATKNDPWLALTAGAFLNGLSGDIALEKHGLVFTPTDAVNSFSDAWRRSLEY